MKNKAPKFDNINKSNKSTGDTSSNTNNIQLDFDSLLKELKNINKNNLNLWMCLLSYSSRNDDFVLENKITIDINSLSSLDNNIEEKYQIGDESDSYYNFNITNQTSLMEASNSNIFFKNIGTDDSENLYSSKPCININSLDYYEKEQEYSKHENNIVFNPKNNKDNSNIKSKEDLINIFIFYYNNTKASMIKEQFNQTNIKEVNQEVDKPNTSINKHNIQSNTNIILVFLKSLSANKDILKLQLKEINLTSLLESINSKKVFFNDTFNQELPKNYYDYHLVQDLIIKHELLNPLLTERTFPILENMKKLLLEIQNGLLRVFDKLKNDISNIALVSKIFNVNVVCNNSFENEFRYFIQDDSSSIINKNCFSTISSYDYYIDLDDKALDEKEKNSLFNLGFLLRGEKHKNNKNRFNIVKNYFNDSYCRSSFGGIVFKITALKCIKINCLGLMSIGSDGYKNTNISSVIDSNNIKSELDIYCLKDYHIIDSLNKLNEVVKADINTSNVINKKETKLFETLNSKVSIKFNRESITDVWNGEIYLNKGQSLVFVVSNFNNKLENEVIRKSKKTSKDFDVNEYFLNAYNDIVISETIDLSRGNKLSFDKEHSGFYYYGEFIGKIGYEVLC